MAAPSQTHALASQRSIVVRALQWPYYFFFENLPRHHYERVGGAVRNAQMSSAELDLFTGPFQPINKSHTFDEVFIPQDMAAGFSRMQHSWDDFVDGLVGDWRLMRNILIVIFGIIAFEIYRGSVFHPFTQLVALHCIICTGYTVFITQQCIFQFRNQRQLRKASRWAFKYQIANGFESNYWNLWILMSLPAIGFFWSLAMFILTAFSSFLLPTVDSSRFWAHINLVIDSITIFIGTVCAIKVSGASWKFSSIGIIFHY